MLISRHSNASSPSGGTAAVTDALATLTPQINLEQDESDLILIDLGNGQNRLGGSALAQVYGHTTINGAQSISDVFSAICGEVEAVLAGMADEPSPGAG